MKLQDFDYNLDISKIANFPASPRDSSKLLILERKSQEFSEKIFADIIDELSENDVLVFNETKVIKARLKGYVVLQDGRKKEVEIFLLKQLSSNAWECQVFPGERLKIGKEVYFEINKLDFYLNNKEYLSFDESSSFYPPDKGGSRGVKYIPYNRELTQLAQKNRKNPTPAENKIYYEVLKIGELGKYKFIRQKPIDNFIVDFYCSKLGIVIEIDGDNHSEQIEYDNYRTEKLNQLGLNVIRYTNSEVLGNKEGVYEDLLNKINPPTPLVRGASGEDLINGTSKNKLNRETSEEVIIVKYGDKKIENEIGKKDNNFKSTNTILSGVVKEITYAGRIIEFNIGGAEFFEIIDKIGEIPLPPYIEKGEQNLDEYNTVFAKYEGSAAAPTAGLHFTNELLEKIKKKGVTIEKVLLHIGLGTFKPITSKNILEHKIHSEYIEISQETAKNLNEYKRQGKRIIAVGTTTTRTLESFSDENGFLNYGEKNTNIFIYPGYKFRFIDSIITNFHLPKSSLLVMISAFYDREKLLEIYDYAQKNDYRFFSFGDVMWIR